jgi:hypothetical protein
MKRFEASVSFKFWAENKENAIEELRELLQSIINDDEELEMMIGEETDGEKLKKD